MSVIYGHLTSVLSIVSLYILLDEHLHQLSSEVLLGTGISSESLVIVLALTMGCSFYIVLISTLR